jgi:hypothetical protein
VRSDDGGKESEENKEEGREVRDFEEYQGGSQEKED